MRIPYEYTPIKFQWGYAILKNWKKRIGFLFSMKFALIILCLFVVACIVGSVIPQEKIAAVYEQSYPQWSRLILDMGLDDVFHSWWFVVLTLTLCINLLGCNLAHLSPILRKMRAGVRPAPSMEEQLPLLTGDPDRLLRELGFRKTCGEVRYGVRNKLGYWGAWLTHLGILIIIVGFALGQMFTVTYTVYGVPGQEKPIGDTGLNLKIDGFSVLLREDETVEQYLAQLTITNSTTGESWSGESSVNHPWDAAGYRLYQNSTGWAADMEVFLNEELIQTTTVCAGEVASIAHLPHIQVYLEAVYPDCVVEENGSVYSASGRLDHPGYAYGLYNMGSLLGEKILMEDEGITLYGRDTEESYTIRFVNPRSYTLIQARNDPFTWLAGIGGCVLLAALFIAFYVRTEEIWLVPEGEGFRVCGVSRKGGLLYREKLIEKIHKCNEVSK